MLKRFALAAVVIVLLTAATTATAALLEIDKDVDLLTSGGDVNVQKGVLEQDVKGKRTIMVLGSDRRAGDGNAPSRADTVMLVRLDSEKGATSVMSLPRDLRVNIPGKGIDKLNAAYALGGENLTIKTVKQLLAPHSPTGKFPITHVININFGGFQRAVNYLNCAYIDVDRKYFNDNNPPLGGGGNYAAIDVPAGYQRLCGEDSLDYVRYRHFDSDLVRGARQQEYLRQAKDQIGIDKLVSDREELFKIMGRYTQTDIRGTGKVLGLIKLAAQASSKPLREIQFPAAEIGSFVTASDAQLDRAVKRFMNADLGVGEQKAPTQSDIERESTRQSAKKKKRKKATTTLAPGIEKAVTEGENVAVKLAPKLPYPVLYPKAKVQGSLAQMDDSRAYTLKDNQNHKYPSYRIVYKTSLVGQYYGVQGTAWPNPPILEEETERKRIGNREFRIYKDGNRIRMIALKNKYGSFWVSNSLLQSLSNKQMESIARSLGTIGSK